MLKKGWMVERDCCTSGNCITCIGKARFGTPVRVVQTIVATKAEAEDIATNWEYWNPTIKETSK